MILRVYLLSCHHKFEAPGEDFHARCILEQTPNLLEHQTLLYRVKKMYSLTMQARHEDTLAAEQRVEVERQKVVEAEAIAAARLQAVTDADAEAQRQCAAADEKVAEAQTACKAAESARDDAEAATVKAEEEKAAAEQVCCLCCIHRLCLVNYTEWSGVVCGLCFTVSDVFQTEVTDFQHMIEYARESLHLR